MHLGFPARMADCLRRLQVSVLGFYSDPQSSRHATQEGSSGGAAMTPSLYVRVINPASEHFGRVGLVDRSDWQSGRLWLQIRFGALCLLLAHHGLEPLS